jgi:oligopeptide/dipeptide ABC transporter ATP-binding protein
MIAMAIACQPALLIADEPTTALDVTIQAQILELLRRLQREMKMSVLLITHDLGVVAENAKEVAVMYAGQIVERGPVRKVFGAPKHPYTRGLLQSVPRPGERERMRLPTIEGIVPDLASLPLGCRFADRCSMVEPRCREAPVALRELDGTRWSRCVRAEEVS